MGRRVLVVDHDVIAPGGSTFWGLLHRCGG